jgi:Uma2 family endonuclease
LIYSDSSQFDEKCGLNVPQFVLEISSPSTAKYDLGHKRRVYERNGALEYWLIDPASRKLKILVRSDETLRELGEFAFDQVMALHAFPEIKINLSMIAKVLDRRQEWLATALLGRNVL